jgi:hypothetical protein
MGVSVNFEIKKHNGKEVLLCATEDTVMAALALVADLL